MTSVMAQLRQWATKQPYWEQLALDKIVTGVHVDDSDYNELLQYLLEDQNLAESTGKRPELQFIKSTEDVSESSFGKVQLTKLYNLQDVNALVPGQTLTFGRSLTAIFGATASGKSGYARILGCAGFTRGDEEVLPDITQPFGDKVPSADIGISNATSTKDIHFQIKNPSSELVSFYVFDSTSVKVHLTGSNTFSFSPAGLNYLTQLGELTDEIRKRLKSKIDECRQPHDFGDLFQGKSEVSEIIKDLGPNTDLQKLKSLASLTSQEKNRIAELELQIAQLKTQDVPEQIKKMTQNIQDLEGLNKSLQEVEDQLNDSVMREIMTTVSVYLERVSQAQAVSIDQFKSEYFTQIGTPLWHQFITTAKELAEAEEIPDKPYPQHQDRCLLCHQPLSVEAINLLYRLWTFLEGEAQQKLDESKTALANKQEELNRIDLDFFDEQSVPYRYLKEHDSALLSRVQAFVNIYQNRQKVALKIIENHKEEPRPPMPESEKPNIENIIAILKTKRSELEKENPAKKIAELEQQLLSLQHRNLLAIHASKVEEYVKNLIWTEKANKIKVSTRHITLKYNELFGQLVTDRYVELFEETLEDLLHPLKVNIKTTPRKGETLKQIALETDSVSPDKVLSEGEKRAVALADFLTEVELDTTSSGIILDDPVTSLDLEWRENIASILTAKATNRQVIVFTHDLPLRILKNPSPKGYTNINIHYHI